MKKHIYEALPGVEWVNGAPVPADRRVHLTDKEARYDVDLVRIRLVDTVDAASQPDPSATDPAKTGTEQRSPSTGKNRT